MKDTRELTVYETTYSVAKYDGIYYGRSKLQFVPQIRLQGKWLEELGFEAGMKINVSCEEGKLIISKSK